MAGTKVKSQTQVSEDLVPASREPSARAKRMMRLGTYVLQAPGQDPARLQPVAEISQEAYRRMEEERHGAAVVVVAPKVGIGQQLPEVDTAEVDNAMETPVAGPEKPKKPAKKSKSASKREEIQKADTQPKK